MSTNHLPINTSPATNSLVTAASLMRPISLSNNFNSTLSNAINDTLNGTLNGNLTNLSNGIGGVLGDSMLNNALNGTLNGTLNSTLNGALNGSLSGNPLNDSSPVNLSSSATNPLSRLQQSFVQHYQQQMNSLLGQSHFENAALTQQLYNGQSMFNSSLLSMLPKVLPNVYAKRPTNLFGHHNAPIKPIAELPIAFEHLLPNGDEIRRNLQNELNGVDPTRVRTLDRDNFSFRDAFKDNYRNLVELQNRGNDTADEQRSNEQQFTANKGAGEHLGDKLSDGYSEVNQPNDFSSELAGNLDSGRLPDSRSNGRPTESTRRKSSSSSRSGVLSGSGVLNESNHSETSSSSLPNDAESNKSDEEIVGEEVKNRYLDILAQMNVADNGKSRKRSLDEQDDDGFAHRNLQVEQTKRTRSNCN